MRIYALDTQDNTVSIMYINKGTIENEIDKLTNKDDIVSYHEIDSSELPTRLYRNAWVYDNGLKHDLEKARKIHMNFIRNARDKALLKQDIEFTKALESGDENKRQAVATLKQTLRDIPQNFNLEDAVNIEELKELWPEEISEYKSEYIKD